MRQGGSGECILMMQIEVESTNYDFQNSILMNSFSDFSILQSIA